MREIKFRVWSKKEKRMLYNAPLKYSNGKWAVEYADAILEDIILMQYVEKKDKNGKEIYEGDIVKIWEGRKMAINDYGSFIYEETEWALGEEDLEVMGNIYEKQNDV